jgi:ketosteroid isomerase-like protein
MADELTMSALSNWLDAYGEAWESRDADAAAKIFSEDANYHVTPYEDPHVGQDGVRNYWAGVTENQRNVQFEYQTLSVTGNTGIAHWSANFDVAPDGPHIELNGIFVLEFDADGKCRRLREWWHLQTDAEEEQD